MTELMVAMALLVIAVLPIGYSISSEKVLARSYYERAVAMEIVDGEMEVLLASEWHNFSPGTQDYSIHANAATNLPPGKFLLTIESGKVRLEWRPDEKHHGGPVIREAVVK
jgi:hypothetical protein